MKQVKTGEENEEILFEERCKLFRWDKDQWKERGLGTMKLLRHKSSAKARLVMRREQVGFLELSISFFNIWDNFFEYGIKNITSERDLS